MIDWVNINLPININTINSLNWTLKVNPNTGEIIPTIRPVKGGVKITTWQNAEVNNMLFRYGKGVVKYDNYNRDDINTESLGFKGSFHKYFNNGLHNYNDFTFSAATNTINQFCNQFCINSTSAKIRTLEFGVNITIPISVNEFVNSLKSYKRKEINIKHYPNGGVEVRFSLSQYELKIYSKGCKHKLGNNLLRFEINVLKSAYLNRLGIVYLSDLLIQSTWEILTRELTKVFSQLVFVKYIRKDRFSSKEQILIEKLKNRDFWIGLSKDQYNHYKNSKFLDSGKKLKAEVLELIEKKCKYLIEH